jgi:hypothetical protein
MLTCISFIFSEKERYFTWPAGVSVWYQQCRMQSNCVNFGFRSRATIMAGVGAELQGNTPPGIARKRMQTALNARNKGLRSPPARLERIIVGTQTFPEPVTPPAPSGQVACSVELSHASSPAEAYVAAFRAGIQGVRSGSLADSPDDLAQVAAAFRVAECEACRWVYRWAGWNGIQARERRRRSRWGRVPG